MKKKTPRGGGYTQRVSGRRVLTSQVLEDRLEAAKAELLELQKQNEKLRAKEALQMELLESCELGLGNMGVFARQSQGDAARNDSLMTAAMLDVQALQLKSELRPAPDPAPVKEALSALQSTFTSPPAAAAMQPQPTSSSSDSASTSASVGSISSGGGCETPDESGNTSRMARVKRLLSSLTPAEVSTFRALTLAQVAERLRTSIGRVALARQVGQRPMLAGGVGVQQAVDDYARLCLLSLVSNEARHCRLVGLNLETLDPAAPAQQLWAECVEKVNLQPKQKQHICTAYAIHSEQQTKLLEQQQEVMQQLQALLGTTGPLQHSLADSGGDAAAAAPAFPAAAARSAAARPAHFMALVAGTAEGAAQQQEGGTCPSPASAPSPAAAAGAAVSAGDVWPEGAAAAAAAAAPGAAAAEQGTSSAALLRRAAAAAAAAAAGSGSGGSSGGAVHLLSVAGASPGLQVEGGSREGATAAGPPAADVDSSEAAGSHRSSSTAAGATTTSSACAGGSSSTAACSSGGNLQGPVDVLPLEDAMRVEQLLQQLMRISLQLKQECRSLATMLMNMFTPEQSAECTLAAYPYMLNSPAFCACVAGAPLPQEARQG